MPRVRLAVLATHPVQYQAPLLRRIAQEPDIELTVLYGSDMSVRPFFDPGFTATIAWDASLLDGYAHEFLPAWGPTDDITFWRPFNTGIAGRLRKGRFDWLMVCGYNRFFHWRALLAAKALGIRVLIRDEATAISLRRGPLKRAGKRAFFAALDRLCDRFLSIGTLNGAYYRDLGIPESKIFPTPYAVDNAFFRSRAGNGAALKRALGIPAGSPVVLYASKLQRRKFPDQVMAAFARLPPGAAARRPHLVFVGDGEMRAGVEAAAAGRSDVLFAGFRGQAELPDWYDMCDVFVLPSVFETWGLVVNEVMNFAKPVVVSDQVGSGHDLVRDGDNGFVVPAGDVGRLAAAVGTIVADPALAARMGRRSLEIVRDWDFEADVRGLRAALGLAV